MKIFTNEKTACDSMENKQHFYLNSVCPFSLHQRICGNWCSLFYLDNTEGHTPYVILGCKNDLRRLYIEEIID